MKGDHQRQLGGHEDRLKDQVWNCLITSLAFVFVLLYASKSSFVLEWSFVWISVVRLVVRTWLSFSLLWDVVLDP